MDRHTLSLGAIFDWDGVIVDSSRYHEESWEKLANREQKLLPENYFKESFGKRNETIIHDILKWSEDKEEIQRTARAKEEIFRSIIPERGLSPLPGVSDFLAMLRREMGPCAVGSSTPYLNISTALKILDFHDCFQTIVAAEDVTVGKPDPQVFLLAAQKLNVPSGVLRGV